MSSKLIYIALILIVSISCKMDNDKVHISIKHSDDNRKEIVKIKENIITYIQSNKDEKIIQAYFKILDEKDRSINKNSLKEKLGLKDEFIILLSSNKSAQISPIPMVNDLERGQPPSYNYKDKNGYALQSFILNFNIDDRLNVEKCWLFMAFRDSVNNKSYKKEFDINDENISIEDFLNL